MAKKTVATFAELKAAVEDVDTTEIELSADVTYTSGIRIPTGKTTLTIDGQSHTITDMNSTAATAALYVPTGFGAANITVKNAVWNGRNYYGVVCVYDDTANADVSVVLQNLSYTGPQIIYNRYGTTTVRNCNVVIDKNGASANAQEFCEANRLVLAGNTTIKSLATSGSVMWFPFAGSALTVASDAVVDISAPNTYLIYSDTAAKPVLTFKSGSSTTINVKSGMFYAAGASAHIASSCTIEHDASLSVTSSANSSVPLFKCGGNFTMKRNSSLSLVLPQGGSGGLMYFSTAANVSMDTPKSVVLYNGGGKVFAFASGGTVSVTAGQINYWTASKTPYTSAGGFDDVPATAVYKVDGDDVVVTQTVTQSAVTNTTSNLVVGDGGYPLGATNFDLTKATVLSVGALSVTVNAVNDLATVVGGSTSPSATVMVTVGGKTMNAVADEEGSFAVTLDKSPSVGEVVEVAANKDFLTTKTSVVVIGSVSVSSLPDIPFNAIGTPRRTATLGRIDPDWAIELTDTRTDGGKWALYVAVESELQSDGKVIDGAVTFADQTTTTLGSAPVLVAEGTTSAPQKIVLSWKRTKGILLDIAQNTVYDSGKYVAKLRWTTEFE